MTFEQNVADREPPGRGGFFIADCRLPILSGQSQSQYASEVKNQQSAIGNRQSTIGN